MSSKNPKILKRNCHKLPEFNELAKCTDELGYIIEIDKLSYDPKDNKLFLNIRDKKKKLVGTRTMNSILELSECSASLLNEISK